MSTQSVLEELDALVGIRQQGVRDAEANLARATVLLQEAEHAARAARPACDGYAWMGQSFKYCDDCGKPFWEHTHEKRNGGRLVPITPEMAEHVKSRWT